MKLFNRAVALSALLLAPLGASAAETYTLDPTHTTVNWSIDHFGFSMPTGKFSRIEGTLLLDEKTPANSKVNATIAIKDLSTGLEELDKHVKSADFLGLDQFPTATFASDQVEVTGPDTARVHGTLTLHGVSKPIVLDVKLNKIADNMFKKHTAGFAATTLIKRSEFGITKYLPGLGDDIPITISAEANLAEAATPAAAKNPATSK